jgi:hypothetical protein
MKNFHLNHYEKAFANFLSDNRIRYIAVDEQKRAALGRTNLKSFDYLLYPPNQSIIIAEVKGRKFAGATFANLSGFECWVTTDDVDGLANWQQIFGPTHSAAFIFAYKIENVDVDFDGREVYDFKGLNYIFFCIKLADYIRFMKVRSPKWKTITLPANKFRLCAVQMQNLML